MNVKYRVGVIFNFDRLLKNCDPTAIFADVSRIKMLTAIVDFLIEGSESEHDARMRINDVEWLISEFYDRGIIGDYLFNNDEPFTKICGILYSMMEKIVDVMVMGGLYRYQWRYEEDDYPYPRVYHISKDNYLVCQGPSLAMGGSNPENRPPYQRRLIPKGR